MVLWRMLKEEECSSKLKGKPAAGTVDGTEGG